MPRGGGKLCPLKDVFLTLSPNFANASNCSLSAFVSCLPPPLFPLSEVEGRLPSAPSPPLEEAMAMVEEGRKLFGREDDVEVCYKSGILRRTFKEWDYWDIVFFFLFCRQFHLSLLVFYVQRRREGRGVMTGVV